MSTKLSPIDIQQLAQAIAQLNSEPDRPKTKVACEEKIAERLGLPWSTIKHRVILLRLRIVPGPRDNNVKPRAWGENWKMRCAPKEVDA